MAILAECPVCHKKHSVKAKACPCGAHLDNEKKNKKVSSHSYFLWGYSAYQRTILAANSAYSRWHQIYDAPTKIY